MSDAKKCQKSIFLNCLPKRKTVYRDPVEKNNVITEKIDPQYSVKPKLMNSYNYYEDFRKKNSR